MMLSGSSESAGNGSSSGFNHRMVDCAGTFDGPQSSIGFSAELLSWQTSVDAWGLLTDCEYCSLEEWGFHAQACHYPKPRPAAPPDQGHLGDAMILRTIVVPSRSLVEAEGCNRRGVTQFWRVFPMASASTVF